MTYFYKKKQAKRNRVSGQTWLIAAGMDQEALDYMVYIGKRRTLKERIPYLDTGTNQFFAQPFIFWLIKSFIKEGE